MFTKGNYIKIKNNSKLVSGEVVNNWAGRVKEVSFKTECCIISLDSETIDLLKDSYLIESIKEDAEPSEYIFKFAQLELSNRRDTDETLNISLNKLFNRVLALEEKFEDKVTIKTQRWIREFMRSNSFEDLSEPKKDNTYFILRTFLDYLFSYDSINMEKWNSSHLKSICLEIVPRQIIGKKDVFENYGEILCLFISYLGDNGYIKNSKELMKTVESIKDQILIEANNPDNWGLAKSTGMSAQSQGFDINNKEDLDKFILIQQLKAFQEINKERGISQRNGIYKKIGRNEKITVRYNDRRIVENVKFKKVESDLKNGLCEIIKK